MNALISHWPSLLLLALSAIPWCYCVLHDQGKLKGFGPDEGFFGFNQYRRKYKDGNALTPKEKTWYYTFFKLKYREAYPLSATLLAWTTDGYHLFQLVWKALVIESAAIITPYPWVVFLSGFSAFTFIFALFYKLLSR